jgi:peptide/nickel transport system substrate-binding protein
MLRGLRWQLLALIVALCLFVAVLALRPGNETVFVSQEGNPVGTTAADNGSTVSNADNALNIAQSSNATEELIPTSAPLTPEVEASALPVDPQSSPVSGTADNLPTYREGLVGQVQRLNPLLASLNPVDQDISSLIYEGLVGINEYGEPIPKLAEAWTVSANRLEYIVTLRQDILWQDGVPFTAADVDYTMALLRSSDFPGDRTVGNFWQTVETHILNDHTVRFRLSQPLGSFLDALRIGILPAHALQGTPASQLANHPFNLSPIGTGPYQLEALRIEESGQIRRVDLRVAQTFRQRPEGQEGYAIERMSFLLYGDFETAAAAVGQGDADGLATWDRRQRPILVRLANSSSVNLLNGIEPSIGFIIFNWSSESAPLLRDQQLRAALQTGLERNFVERFVSDFAIRADSPLPLNSWAYTDDLPWPAYSVEQARNLLTQVAGEVNETATEEPAATEEIAATDEAVNTAEATPEGSLAFTLLTPDDPALVGLAQEIVTQWELIGVTVTIDAVDVETYSTRLQNHDFEIALIELSKAGTADPDLYSFWHQGQYPDGENYGGADDRVISEILEEARRDPFGINRIAAYHRFQEEFVRRAIAIPLYTPLFTYALTSRVQGAHLQFIGEPSDRFLTIKGWTLVQ